MTIKIRTNKFIKILLMALIICVLLPKNFWDFLLVNDFVNHLLTFIGGVVSITLSFVMFIAFIKGYGFDQLATTTFPFISLLHSKKRTTIFSRINSLLAGLWFFALTLLLFGYSFNFLK